VNELPCKQHDSENGLGEGVILYAAQINQKAELQQWKNEG
jgi:hypothetical protein